MQRFKVHALLLEFFYNLKSSVMDLYCIFKVLLQYIFLSDIRNYMS